MSGLIADAKTLIDRARVEAQVNKIFLIHCFFYKFNKSCFRIIGFHIMKK